MNKFKLTILSKILIFIFLIFILLSIIYLINGIYYISDTNKLIINNKLILKNGFCYSLSKNIYKLKNFPSSYDINLLPDELNNENNLIYVTKNIPLELQLNDGSIYKCNFFIVSTFDENWVLKNKKSPIIIIPEYTLNSYILDYIGNYSKTDLFKAETKNKLELLIKEWLINNTKEHGIIIKQVKINTVFMPL